MKFILLKRSKRTGRIRLTQLGRRVCGCVVMLLLVTVIVAFSSAAVNRAEVKKEQAAEGMLPYLGEIDDTETEPSPEKLAAELAAQRTQEPTATPTLEPIPTPEPTAAPTPMETPPSEPDYSTTTVRMPTAEETQQALSGMLSTGGVALRSGPSSEFKVLSKYDADTLLTVYGTENDYCFVKVQASETYGYIAAKFVAVSTAAATAPEGSVQGTVTANRLALRNAPDADSDDTRIGYLQKGSVVYVYAQTGEFYHLRAGNIDCYACAKYITVDTAVPSAN